MSFMDSIKTCIAKYIDGSGRARRSEFWWFALAAAIVNWLLSTIIIGGNIYGTILSDPGSLANLGGKFAFYSLASLAITIPLIAAGVRRLHDLDKPGVMVLLGLIPLVGFYLLYLYAQEGTSGPNQYGPDPKA